MGQCWVPLSIILLCVSLTAAKKEYESFQTFIVRFQNDLKPSVFPDVEHWYSSTLQSLGSNPLQCDRKPKIASSSQKPEDFVHLYRTAFHGFAARLTPQQAQQLKNCHGVLAVFPDHLRRLQTTRSPEFLGLVSNNLATPDGLLTHSDSGSKVIIGVLDTGICPERRSFHDEGLGPIPSHWKGVCSEGENFTKSHCNKKIIGARYFTAGYEASGGKTDVKSARDTEGHGTHTASIAAGRAVKGASLFGFARGVAVGIAPKARIAVYKTCWDDSCRDSDLLAAFDKAVEDGVDIISISIVGSTIPYYQDPIAIGAFGAMEKGVLISAAAGNDGPDRMTVTNEAPWITTVGAGTIDRKFPADLVFEDGRVINGESLYHGPELHKNTYYPLINAGNASADKSHFGILFAALCAFGSLDKRLVSDKIVVCDQGSIEPVEKGEAVKHAGGAGVVVANVKSYGETIIADSYSIPGLSITASAGRLLHNHISSNQNPKAKMVFRGTKLGARPAPAVASFSSRGPSVQSIYVLKPDIIAPGVNILAAWPDKVAPSLANSDKRRTEFNIESGTSMSCPHVSGLAALLKGAHPDWSPAMIKSALMTTAYTHDHEGKRLLDSRAYHVSTVWAMGAGHVDPEKALDPGLVYDLTLNDYINFLCASNYTHQQINQIAGKGTRCTESQKRFKPWNLNYPAISVAFDVLRKDSFDIMVTRTVTHVGGRPSSYSVRVSDLKGAKVTVDPPKMEFVKKGEQKSYKVRIKAEKLRVRSGELMTKVGKLIWSDGKHQVVSPIILVWREQKH